MNYQKSIAKLKILCVYNAGFFGGRISNDATDGVEDLKAAHYFYFLNELNNLAH